MRIKEIKDLNIQQMAVVNVIKFDSKYTLSLIMDLTIYEAFYWDQTSQGYEFWDDVFEGRSPNYTDKGLWYRRTKSNEYFTFGKLYQCKKSVFEECSFINHKGYMGGCKSFFTLASPEEVYYHLNKETKFEEPMKEDESKNVYVNNTNTNQPTNLIDTKQSSLIDQNRILEALVEQLKNEKQELEDKFNKVGDLVASIYILIQNPDITIEDFYLNVRSEVCNYHNPSIIGQEREVFIDGKKYVVKVEKELIGWLD